MDVREREGDEFDVQSHASLKCLMHWANTAHRYTRQRDHKGFKVVPDEIPPLEVLYAQRITELPVEKAQPDDVLDAADAADAAPAAAAAAAAAA